MRLPEHTNPIEDFKSSHWKEETGWVNETTSLDHVSKQNFNEKCISMLL
ncbi:hypothetical protein Hanom_Chr03g00232771 [Helianthus anomalus]